MPYYKKMPGELCYLSPLQPSDAEKWAQWFNDLEVSLPLGSEAHTTLGFEYLQKDAFEAIQEKANVFTIVECQTDRPIGRSVLFGISWVDRSANFGIFIGEKDCWGRGFGQEATILTLDYAFNLLNLHSVTLGVFAFNQRGIHAYQKVGFQEIGRQREARLIAGKAYDVVLMDILAGEFNAAHPSRVKI